MNEREWFSANQLAGLPGVPTTERGVQLLAKRDAWSFRKREGRGGGREYHISSLPAATRDHFARKAASAAAKKAKTELARELLPVQMDAAAAERRRMESLAQSVHLPKGKQARMDACIALVTAAEALMRSAGISWRAARLRFAAAYNAGEIEVPADVRGVVRRVSASVLDKWKSEWRREGVCALRGRQGEHLKGKTIIDEMPEVRDLIIGMMVEHPHCRGKHVMRALEARFGSTPEIAGQLPGLRSVQRWMTAWKNRNENVFTAISNPDAWKNRFMSAAGSASADVVRLNQRWEEDSTPGDIAFSDGSRHAVIGVIDVYSRRLTLHLARTSTAVAVAAATRKAILLWGVAECIVTDNGADYVSNHIERCFKNLDVEHRVCDPFSPEQKPHIERALGTFAHDLVELLPGFIGHNVAEREAIRARQSFAKRLMTKGETVELNMTPAKFQEFCDAWCESIYGREPHSALGNRSPFDMVAAWREPVRRITDERVLDLLLAEAPDGGLRKIGKKGLQIDNAYYDHPDLGARIGDWVKVLYDDADIGRVYVFSAGDGAFLCVAECPERSDAGLSRQELAALRKAKQAQHVAAERAALKAVAKRANAKDIVEEIVADKVRRASNVAMFPKPEIEHDAPAITHARAAVESAPRIVADLTPEDEAIAAELWARYQSNQAGDTGKVVQLPTAAPAVDADGRPQHFEDDCDYARWLMANREKAGPLELEWLEERLTSISFRLLMGLEQPKEEAADRRARGYR